MKDFDGNAGFLAIGFVLGLIIGTMITISVKEYQAGWLKATPDNWYGCKAPEKLTDGVSTAGEHLTIYKCANGLIIGRQEVKP